MRFRQLDVITELDPGRSIVARRTLRAEEDYLRDHFPHFPVMPGVMMLEACYQAAMWMVRTGENFASPLVLLHEARGIKFADFLAPGETLEIRAEKIKEDETHVHVKVEATKEGKTSVSGRLVLEKTSPRSSEGARLDHDISERTRQQFTDFFGPPESIPKPAGDEQN